MSAGGNAHEPVLVGGVKVHRPFIVAQRRQNARITRRVSTLDTVESPRCWQMAALTGVGMLPTGPLPTLGPDWPPSSPMTIR